MAHLCGGGGGGAAAGSEGGEKVDITSRLDPSTALASPQNTWISRHRLPECVHCVLEVLIQNLVTYPQ